MKVAAIAGMQEILSVCTLTASLVIRGSLITFWIAFILALVVNLSYISMSAESTAVPVRAIHANSDSRSRATFIRNLGNVGERSSSRPGLFNAGAESPGWVDPRADLGILEKRKFVCVCRDSNQSSSSPYPSHCTDYIIFHKYLQVHCCIYRSILAHSQRESRISEYFKAQNSLTDCGVYIWPWHLFAMEEADRPFFVTC